MSVYGLEVRKRTGEVTFNTIAEYALFFLDEFDDPMSASFTKSYPEVTGARIVVTGFSTADLNTARNVGARTISITYPGGVPTVNIAWAASPFAQPDHYSSHFQVMLVGDL